MINIREQGGKTAAYLAEFTVDKEDEIAELPVFPACAKGSVCLCIEDSTIYILNGENEWVAL